MNDETKEKIKAIFTDLEALLDGLEDTEDKDASEEALGYAEWMLRKAQLRYTETNKAHNFPILYKRVYWAHIGMNVGREEDKHRPVVIVRTERKSPICYVVPLTTQRLEDEYWFHVDLDGLENTALVEHFKTISKDRIDKPLMKKGDIAEVTTDNMREIHKEIKRMFANPPKPRK
jgi:mRNA-degrading endonuclease toxin of MazEF toxin-antitoxin module